MNWFRRILRGFERRAVSFWSDKLSWGGLFSAGQMASAGVLVTPDKALSLTAYFAAISRIATDVAGLPLTVYRYRDPSKPEKGRDLILDHPIVTLLQRSPNGGESTSMRWRQAINGHMLGWGNGYAEIEFDNGGRPIGLHLLDPAITHAERKPQDKRLFYRTGANTLPPSRVLHLAGFGFDGLSGYSPATLHREAIGLGLGLERHGASFIGNGTRLSGVIELPYKLKDIAAVDQLKKGWNTEYSGPDNAGRVAVIEQGGKFSPISVSPEDAQYLQTREFQVIEIARMFGIPPHKIGDYSNTGSAYKALEEANLDYLSTTIVPWCESIEQTIELRLLTTAERDKGFHVEHDVSAFLRGDSKARGELYAKLLGFTVLTPNQIAAKEGINPFGPDGDKRYLSVQFTPLEIALQPKPAPAPPGQKPPTEPDGTDPTEPDADDEPTAQRFALNGNGHVRTASEVED